MYIQSYLFIDMIIYIFRSFMLRMDTHEKSGAAFPIYLKFPSDLKPNGITF